MMKNLGSLMTKEIFVSYKQTKMYFLWLMVMDFSTGIFIGLEKLSLTLLL